MFPHLRLSCRPRPSPGPCWHQWSRIRPQGRAKTPRLILHATTRRSVRIALWVFAPSGHLICSTSRPVSADAWTRSARSPEIADNGDGALSLSLSLPPPPSCTPPHHKPDRSVPTEPVPACLHAPTTAAVLSPVAEPRCQPKTLGSTSDLSTGPTASPTSSDPTRSPGTRPRGRLPCDTVSPCRRIPAPL